MSCEKVVCKGSVVRSVAGRDRNRLFMITGISECADGNYCVMISDGALHPLSKPKKKNIRHLAVLATGDGGETSVLLSDSELRSYLEEFESFSGDNDKKDQRSTKQ